MARVRIPSADHEWKSDLLFAARQGNTESIVKLTKHRSYNVDVMPWIIAVFTEAVFTAANQRHASTVEALLNVDDVNSGLVGIKALEQAAKKRKKLTVDILLQNGTDVNYKIPKEHYYDTTPPLIAAIYKGSREIVQLLLQHGASSCATDDYYSALMTAADGGHIGIVDDLLKAGANPDIIGPHNACDDFCTALHLAALYRVPIEGRILEYRNEPETNFALLKLLLLAGASVKFEEMVQADPRFIRVTSDEELDEWQDREDEPGQWTYATFMEEGEFSGPLEAMYEYGYGPEEGYAESIDLLYAAGASVRNIERSAHPSRFTKYIREKQQEKEQPPCTLQDRCRRQIRDHLFSSTGANHGNLVYAVSNLPMPTQIKKYLLFDVPNIFEGPE